MNFKLTISPLAEQVFVSENVGIDMHNFDSQWSGGWPQDS